MSTPTAATDIDLGVDMGPDSELEEGVDPRRGRFAGGALSRDLPRLNACSGGRKKGGDAECVA